VILPRSAVVRVFSIVAAVSLALAFSVVFARPAYACSCSGLSGQAAAQRADAIFQGRVLEKSTVRKPRPGRTEIRFEVSRVFKGSVYREQVVASPQGGDGCGIDPDVNSVWVIFAEDRIEGSGNDAVFRLVTQLCSGNLPGSTPPVTLGRGRVGGRWPGGTARSRHAPGCRRHKALSPTFRGRIVRHGRRRRASDSGWRAGSPCPGRDFSIFVRVARSQERRS